MYDAENVEFKYSRLRRHLKANFHLTISMRGQRATDKIQRNNYHHGSCVPSLTGKTLSVFLIFTQGTHRNVKNRWARSSLQVVFTLYRIVERSVAENVPDRASIHTRNAAFEAVSSLEQY